MRFYFIKTSKIRTERKQLMMEEAQLKGKAWHCCAIFTKTKPRNKQEVLIKNAKNILFKQKHVRSNVRTRKNWPHSHNLVLAVVAYSQDLSTFSVMWCNWELNEVTWSPRLEGLKSKVVVYCIIWAGGGILHLC